MNASTMARVVFVLLAYVFFIAGSLGLLWSAVYVGTLAYLRATGG